MIQLLSNQSGSITLQVTGGKVSGTFDGRDVGKNSPGQRWRASTNRSPIRIPRSRGARTFESRFLLAFCGQTNTSRESPVTASARSSLSLATLPIFRREETERIGKKRCTTIFHNNLTGKLRKWNWCHADYINTSILCAIIISFRAIIRKFLLVLGKRSLMSPND